MILFSLSTSLPLSLTHTLYSQSDSQTYCPHFTCSTLSLDGTPDDGSFQINMGVSTYHCTYCTVSSSTVPKKLLIALNDYLKCFLYPVRLPLIFYLPVLFYHFYHHFYYHVCYYFRHHFFYFFCYHIYYYFIFLSRLYWTHMTMQCTVECSE